VDCLLVLDSIETISILPKSTFLCCHSCVYFGVVLQLATLTVELLLNKSHGF
jgi:hypothetical protein